MLIIPAIDLKDGACVRLRQGLMDDATVFSDDPVAMAAKWVEAGCRRLHLVDLNGAFEGKPVNGDAVTAIARRYPDLPIQIGGGIRSLDTIEEYVKAGVSYVIIGTKAVKEPEFVGEACRVFPGKVIVGLDAKDGFVATDGWAEVSTIQVVDLAKPLGDREVESHFFGGLALRGLALIAIRRIEATAREGHLPGPGVSLLLCALDEQDRGRCFGAAQKNGHRGPGHPLARNYPR